MDARLDYLGNPMALKFVKHINSAGAVLHNSALPAATQELAEQGTRIADAAGGVTDEARANAAKHYDHDQLVALVAVIALINAYNRMNVIIRHPAGDYQPGQFG